MGKDYLHVMVWNKKKGVPETHIVKSDSSNSKATKKLSDHIEASIRRQKRNK